MGTTCAGMNEPSALREASCPFHLRAAADAGQAVLDSATLGCMAFGTPAASSSDVRVVSIPLECLDRDSCADLWLSELPVRTGTSQGVHYACNDEVLFGWTSVTDTPSAQLIDISRDVYTRIGALLAKTGFTVYLRTWNYLEDINEGSADSERYRLFVKGRFDALAGQADFERALPAATAIGTRQGGLVVCFLAGRRAAQQIENPRQVSAFRYPSIYGPRSPSFSRATLQHWRDASVLFVSGTASVVGHRTLHPGDARAQFDEILTNLRALLELAREKHFDRARAGAFAPAGFKVYVREPGDLALISELAHRSLSGAPVVILRGDICRRDLSVEIEAVYRYTTDGRRDE